MICVSNITLTIVDPYSLRFNQECPQQVHVSGADISITLSLHDEFGTLVTGEIITANNPTVSLSGDCLKTVVQYVNAVTGMNTSLVST